MTNTNNCKIQVNLKNNEAALINGYFDSKEEAEVLYPYLLELEKKIQSQRQTSTRASFPAPTQSKPQSSGTKTCSLCGKPMKLRDGKRGQFWGCTGYPSCKSTAQL